MKMKYLLVLKKMWKLLPILFKNDSSSYDYCYWCVLMLRSLFYTVNCSIVIFHQLFYFDSHVLAVKKKTKKKRFVSFPCRTYTNQARWNLFMFWKRINFEQPNKKKMLKYEQTIWIWKFFFFAIQSIVCVHTLLSVGGY